MIELGATVICIWIIYNLDWFLKLKWRHRLSDTVKEPINKGAGYQPTKDITSEPPTGGSGVPDWPSTLSDAEYKEYERRFYD